jgi:N-acetylmuramoyl-L-alanine amidase
MKMTITKTLLTIAAGFVVVMFLTAIGYLPTDIGVKLEPYHNNSAKAFGIMYGEPEIDQKWNLDEDINVACESKTSELQCMQCALYWEARSESSDAQFLVGETILNRVSAKQYPDSICGVVWQRKQFSFTHDGKTDTMSDRGAINQTFSMAKEILENDDYGNSEIGIETSPTAMFYHDDSIDPPYWTANMTVYAVTESFFFYEK